MSEREKIVAWLRAEADYARHAQASQPAGTEKLYRMGQKDGLMLAAIAIERGDHLNEGEEG